MESKPRTLAFATVLLISAMLVPTSSADFTDNDPTAWGVEYEWTNLDDDIEVMTTVSLEDIILDVSEAANFAGFDLTYVQANSGGTGIFIEQWEGGTTTLVDADGDTHTVHERYTQLTVRHAILMDQAAVTSWADASTATGESIDATAFTDTEQMLVADILYTEYVTTDLEFVGADVTMSGELSMAAIAGLELLVEAGGETIDWDVEASASFGIEIQSLDVQSRMYEPTPLVDDLINAAPGDEVETSCSSTTMSSQCGEVSGTFQVATSYDLSLTGLPADELGLQANAFDITISDSLTDSGSFTGEEFELGLNYYFLDTPTTLDVIVESGATAIPVQPVMGFPMAPGLAETLALGMMHAADGSTNSAGVVDVIEQEMNDWMDDVNDQGDPEDFVCTNGNTVDYALVNNGFDDCGDNSDENNVSGTTPAQQFQDKMNAMGDAMAASNFELTMETFADRLEYHLEDYESNVPYEDGEPFMLWSDDEARFVGMMMLVEDDLGATYNFLGPDSPTYADAPAQISMTYHTGIAASDAQDLVANLVTLNDLAPTSNHDMSGINALLGNTGSGGSGSPISSTVPSIGGLATLVAIGTGAMLVGQGHREEE